MRDLSNKVIRL